MSTMTVSAGFGGRTAVDRRPGRAAGASQPASAPAPAHSVRLTRRGRLLVTGLVLMLLVVAAVLLSGGVPASAGTDRGSGATAERVTVRPGETLWQIAERVAPRTDPRETVARILDLNGLQTAQVQAGTALLLP